MKNIELREFDAVSRHGVIHLRAWARDEGASIDRILVLLHPMPHDGAFFQRLHRSWQSAGQLSRPITLDTANHRHWNRLRP